MQRLFSKISRVLTSGLKSLKKTGPVSTTPFGSDSLNMVTFYSTKARPKVAPKAAAVTNAPALKANKI
jgi:hypothetical protein